MSFNNLSLDEDLSLALPDGKKMYYILNRATSQPAKGVIILAHGLTGRAKEFIHVTAKNIFNAAGFDVVRIWFYHWPDDARDLVDCTVKIHGQDLAAAVAHFRPQYKKVFVAGHSYGGFAMAHAFAVDGGKTFNPNAVSFWDASFTPTWYQNAKHWPESDTFSYRNGQDPRMGRALYEEAMQYNATPPDQLYGQFDIPSQVVLAIANKNTGHGREVLFKALRCQKEEVRIHGADHEFTAGDTAQQLCAETLRWFEGFCSG